MLLISADRAREYAEFTPETGTLKYFMAGRVEQAELQARISGRYAMVDKTQVLFYREGAVLKLCLAGRTYEVKEEVTAEYKRGSLAAFIEQLPGRNLQKNLSQLLRVQNTFNLLSNAEGILNFNYIAPLRDLHIFDPTPLTEGEDFDFMLFVHNVINSPDRRNNIWRD